MKIHVGYTIGAIFLAVMLCAASQAWKGQNFDADMVAQGCIQTGRDGQLSRTGQGLFVEGKAWFCDQEND